MIKLIGLLSLWIHLTEGQGEELINFEEFKLKYRRSYGSEFEERRSMRVFQMNYAIIEQHNLKYDQHLSNFKLAVNEYADWNPMEFQNTMNGNDPWDNRSRTSKTGGLIVWAVNRIPPLATGSSFNQTNIQLSFTNISSGNVSFIPPANVTLPDAVDWRDAGAVTPVKKQMKCGSCWAFAATGALEGQNFLKNGELIPLSEQNLLDCTGDYGNHGCQGGKKERAFLYVRDNGGIATAESYPYVAYQNQECYFNETVIGAQGKGYASVTPNDEEALTAALATVGPVAIALNGRCLKLQFYSEGVFDDITCDQTHLTHAMLIVGYGRDNVTQMDFWVVKNSWGPEWGMDGYVMVPRNINYAGMAGRASFPLM